MDNIENIFKDMNKIGVKQVILQGPPGTSKTHGAKEIIVSVLNDKNKDNTKDITIESLRKYKLTEKHYTDNELKEDVYWDIVQFHPSYSYEDFVRGISVVLNMILLIKYLERFVSLQEKMTIKHFF